MERGLVLRGVPGIVPVAQKTRTTRKIDPSPRSARGFIGGIQDTPITLRLEEKHK